MHGTEETNFWQGDLKQERPLGIPKHRWENGIKMDFKEMGWEGMGYIYLCEIGGFHGGGYRDDIAGDMMPCSLLEVYVCYPSTLKMGVVCSSKTSMNFYQTTWHRIQKTDLDLSG
jgi:hypothetical protein